MDGPVDFIDTEKIIEKLEAMDRRLDLMEGILEAIVAELGVQVPAPRRKDGK